MTPPSDITAARERLAELARKASPGAWNYEASGYVSGPEHKGIIAGCGPTYGGATDEHRANAAFIAAANPETVLQLLSYICSLEGQNKTTAEVLKWAGAESVSSLASSYKTAQANWELTLDRAELAESTLSSLREAVGGLVEAGRPFAEIAPRVTHYYAREDEVLCWASPFGGDLMLSHFRALSSALSALEGSARAGRDAASSSRPDSQHSDGGEK